MLGSEGDVAGKKKINMKWGRQKALETKVSCESNLVLAKKDNVILPCPTWVQLMSMHLAPPFLSHICPCVRSALLQVLLEAQDGS